jgi:formylmethanofuran dehydrogenase subunit E
MSLTDKRDRLAKLLSQLMSATSDVFNIAEELDKDRDVGEVAMLLRADSRNLRRSCQCLDARLRTVETMLHGMAKVTKQPEPPQLDLVNACVPCPRCSEAMVTTHERDPAWVCPACLGQIVLVGEVPGARLGGLPN